MAEDTTHSSVISGTSTSSNYEVATPEEKKDTDDNSKQLDDGEADFVVDNTRPSSIKKYTDWPIREIREPHDNDVLYGRGGEFFSLPKFLILYSCEILV
jgi:hypothetical protein